MNGKPTPKQIAAGLSRMLHGTDNPSDNDFAQCRTMNVSYPDFAKMCGYVKPKDIPPELLEAVYNAATNIPLIVGFGGYTVLVGADFHCKPTYPDYDWPDSS